MGFGRSGTAEGGIVSERLTASEGSTILGDSITQKIKDNLRLICSLPKSRNTFRINGYMAGM